jgi:hypothetical protein
MSQFTNLKIASIDNALTELEPILAEFGRAHAFTLTRSQEGTFNVPRRWLRRELSGIHHEIGLVIASPMSERLERGFSSDIPCTLYCAAFDRSIQRHYQAQIVEAQPFDLLRDSLSRHLEDALARLDSCTAEFIARYGICDQS